MAISNAFDNINEFTNKKRVEQIVPAIGQALFKADCGFSGVQIGLAALAIYNALSVLPDMLCLVDSSQMVEYMSNAIEQVHRLNNDKKVHHIKQTPSELLAIVVALGWMEINNGVMHLTDKWIKFTTISSALSPSVEKIDQSKRRVKQVKHSKLSQPQLFKVALKSLEDTGYHVHRRIGETVNEVLIRFKQEYSKDSKKKMFKLLQEEMYVHKGSELLVGLPNLYSEYFADARGRLYHAACFGPNPQSGDMARAYYSHNVENWVEKGTQAYDIFMTELEDVAGKDRWLQPKMLRSVAEL